jgi:hypothetical protein
MKKSSVLTVALIVISIGLLNAQTTKGKYLVELSSDLLSLGYSSSTSKSDNGGSDNTLNSFTVGLRPSAGYFVIDNLALGLGFNITYSVGNLGEDNQYSYMATDIGPFVRYYIPTSKVLPFFQLDGSVGSQVWDINDGKNKFGVTKYGGGIGMAVPLGERIMGDLLLGYYSETTKDKEDNENNSRRVAGTLGLSIGFTILLGS